MNTPQDQSSDSSLVSLVVQTQSVGFDIDGYEDLLTGEYIVRDVVTNKKTDLVLVLAGPEHPLRKKKQFARSRKVRAHVAKYGKLPSDDPEDEENEAPLELATYILGWRGLLRGGVPVPYSYEEAVRLLRDPKRRWLFDQVKAALDERELFIKTCGSN